MRFISPTERAIALERENGALMAENRRLREIVGSRETEDMNEVEEQVSAPTLVEQTDALEEAIALLADVISGGMGEEEDE